MKKNILAFVVMLAMGVSAATASFGAVSFIEPGQLPLPFEIGNKSGSVTGLAKADFNGDGKLDVAAVYDVGGVAFAGIFLGEGDGRFKAPITVQLPIGEYNVMETGGIVARDLDRDGKADLAVTATDSRGTHQIRFYKGAGDGTLKSAVVTVTSESWNDPPSSLQSADLNGDAISDLVTLNRNSNSASILFGNGDGSFTTPARYFVGANPTEPVIADFNEDGAPDVVVSSYNDMNYTVLLNDGSGGFSSSQAAGGMQMTGIFPGDFNGDGFIDLMAGGVAPNVSGANCYTDCLAFYPGNGDGSFAPVTSSSFSNGGTWHNANNVPKEPLDIDGDGNHDIIFPLNSGGGYNQILVGLGKGDGSFVKRMWTASSGTTGTNSTLVDGANPVAALWGDFTGDGMADLIVAETLNNARNGGLSIMVGKGNGNFAAPRVYRTSRSVATHTRNLAVGDFNGDGTADTVLLTGALDFMRGNGDGTFLSGDLYGSTQIMGSVSGPGEFFNSLRTADFDRDGDLDLVWMATAGVQGGPAPRMFVAYGDGSGMFTPQVFHNYTDWYPNNAVVADFNNDTYPDLAVWVGRTGDYSHILGHLEVYLFNPISGTFAAAAGYPQTDLGLLTVYPGHALAAGDFNGDGKADLIAHSTLSFPDGSVPERLIFFAGNGNGTFASPVTAGYGLPVMRDFTASDVDGDGRLDLIGAGGNGAYLLLGNGDGSFAAPSYHDAGRGASSAAAAVDFDGDGSLDLGVTSGNSFVVFPGNGNGTFGAMRKFAIGDPNASHFLTADLNGDGKQDVVTMHGGDNNAVITPLLNNSGPLSNLKVTVSQDGNSVGIGREMIYTVRVTNDGPDMATGVVLSTEFSRNGEVLSITPVQGTCSGLNSALCAMGDLAPGGEVSLALIAAPAALGDPLWLAAGVGAISTDVELGDNGASLSTAVTMAEPLAPVNVAAAGYNGRAMVSFTAPTSDGGSAITSYIVTANPGGVTGTGTASPIAIDGLTNGTAYTFTVTAANAVGTGAESAPSAAATICPLGDLSLNGTVDLGDALQALRIAVNLISASPAQLDVGDIAPFVDGTPQRNGRIDIADALLVLRKVVKLVDF